MVVGAMALLMATPWPAHAYLDPGTGSLILQGIIGTVAGALVALRLYWKRIKVFFAAKSAVKSLEDSDPDNI
jgi:hypothetical protein